MSERMTDLERAAALVKELTFRWCTKDPCPPEELDALAAAALAATRREGAEQASGEIRALRKALHDETMKRLASAEQMRERALETARDGVRVAFGERRDEEFIDESDVIGSIEDAFASVLPLTPEASCQQGAPCGNPDACPAPKGCGHLTPEEPT